MKQPVSDVNGCGSRFMPFRKSMRSPSMAMMLTTEHNVSGTFAIALNMPSIVFHLPRPKAWVSSMIVVIQSSCTSSRHSLTTASSNNTVVSMAEPGSNACSESSASSAGVSGSSPVACVAATGCSSHSPQCLHFLALAIISSPQYGQRLVSFMSNITLLYYYGIIIMRFADDGWLQARHRPLS